MSERELLAAMRAAPSDAAPRLVYADELLARGDLRGELIILDERERAGAAMSVEQLDRLLELASIHGFPRLPDDPCAAIFRWNGGGSHPTQYTYQDGRHHYYLRWRHGFQIEVDGVTVCERELATLATDAWTFRETTVILAIVSDAIRAGRRLADLVFPDQRGFREHPRFHPGRAPLYGFPDGIYDRERRLELRDYSRWYGLWVRRVGWPGRRPLVDTTTIGCACGVAGLSCGVAGCR